MARRTADDMPLGPTRAQLETLVRYYTIRQIARQYQVGHTTVWRWCQACNIRPPLAKRFPLGKVI